MLFKLAKEIDKDTFHNLINKSSVLLVANDEKNDFLRLLSFADNDLTLSNADVLIWKTLYDKISIDSNEYRFHIFQYRSLSGFLKFVWLLLNFRKKFQTHILTYRSSDKPFSTQMGTELVSLFLRPRYVIAVHPSGTKYYSARSQFSWIANMIIFALKVVAILIAALTLSLLILLIAIVTRPFIYRKTVKCKPAQ